MKTRILAGVVAAACLGGWCGAAQAQGEPIPAPPPPDEAPLSEPLHQTFTREAWAAFRAGDYQLAIAQANECIGRFGANADGIEAILEKKKANLPTGTVSEADKELIRPYQMLHDVATCLLITAWAAERQGKKEDAIRAYTKVAQYSYARIRERPEEPYWSPGEVATQQLKKLSQ